MYIVKNIYMGACKSIHYVILQIYARKISAASVETLKKKEGETQFTTKTKVPPPLNANVIYFLG